MKSNEKDSTDQNPSKEVKEIDVNADTISEGNTPENDVENPEGSADLKVKKSPDKVSKKGKKTAKSKKAESQKKVKILADNLPGKYLLPWNKGQIVKIENKQADELIEAGDAEEAK